MVANATIRIESDLRALLPELGARTLVMGVLNVTPDSFSDGGLFGTAHTAVPHAIEMQEEGADIIDIGGESTRPGHVEVPAEEEQRRVLPVIRELAGKVTVPISVDTYKASTARAVLNAGVSIVNDVWGLQRDADMASVVAEFGAMAIIMHNRREIDPSLDIGVDMLAFFERSLELARRAGISDSQIILDPGIGFGKTWEQHLEAIRQIPKLKALGFPVLVGISRKSVLGRFYDVSRPPRDRLFGTIAAHVMAIGLGTDIVRVHDVKPHIEACRVADAIRGK